MTSITIDSLPSLFIEPAVRIAFLEDLGRTGDITTEATIPLGMQACVVIRARESGYIAGLDCACMAFRLMDPNVYVDILIPDGSPVVQGSIIATIEGSARAIITAERVALNFLGHLSGIATATHNVVHAIQGTKAKICCTRKTTPGLRIFEKYAVRAGGGVNHRLGLDDAMLIKDNHIAVAGSVYEAIKRARARVGHMVKIEVEVDTLDQLEDALKVGIEVVLLDNMSPTQLSQAVKLVAGRAITEASGHITADNALIVAETGVDFISCGCIIHSAPRLDLGLDFNTILDQVQ
jgi:nicotinate-nucleotide pyrophosphorylase (carboxylating)